jgi:uncharacterized metal-binding protein YceD (DUF177 family)
MIRTVKVEFQRLFGVERLGVSPVSQTIQASPDECAALAQRFGLSALIDLNASLQLYRLADSDFIRVDGRFEADVVQICVVTLESFPTHIEDSFSSDFSTGDANLTDFLPEIVVDIDEEPVEPIVDGVIDMGELVAQYLSLALDPYPRAPGVSLDAVWESPDGKALSPFAVLKKLKQDS